MQSSTYTIEKMFLNKVSLNEQSSILFSLFAVQQTDCNQNNYLLLHSWQSQICHNETWQKEEGLALTPEQTQESNTNCQSVNPVRVRIVKLAINKVTKERERLEI